MGDRMVPEGGTRGEQGAIGRSVLRVDGREKVMGTAQYADDLHVAGMAHAACIHSRMPHATAEVDGTAALALPGTLAVLTMADFPKPQSMLDWYYCTDHPRFVGDVVAVVVARTQTALDEAVAAVKVRYHALPVTGTIEEALAPDAPQVREKGVGLVDGLPSADVPGNIFLDSYKPLRKGNVEAGFAAADVVIERHFFTGYVEHAYIEPESVLAVPQGDLMLIRSCSQQGHMPQDFVADCLQVPMARVRSEQCVVGGSFGGKFEMAGLMCGRAALAARAVGLPVKMTYTREDSLLESPKRHPFSTRVRVGAASDGRIIAYDADQVENAGAYNNQAPWMNIRARVHSAGPYSIPNVRTNTYGVFTNNPVPGAFRGYSSPQVIFGNEMAIEELADALGTTSVALKRTNLLRRGDATATGQVLVHQTVLADMMEDILVATDYEAKDARYRREQGRIRRGVGLVTSYRGAALGGEGVDASGAFLIAHSDGSFTLRAALMEIGQGLQTVYAQICSEASGIALADIQVAPVDTSAIPDSGLTVASRSTAQGGQSVRMAGEAMRAMLLETARRMLGAAPEEEVDLVQSRCFVVSQPERSVPLSAVCVTRKYGGEPMGTYQWYVPRDLVNDDETGQGEAFTTYAYGCCVAEVAVNTGTGRVRVERVTSYHDVGRALNPELVRGQVCGGILMGIGFGLTEEVRMDKGKTGDVNLDAYLIPTAQDAPKIDVRLYECDDPEGTFGAKCIAEAATEMVGTAVALAVKHAIDRPVRRVPLTPRRVLELLAKEEPVSAGGRKEVVA